MGIDPEILGLPSEYACTRLKCGFAGWKNTLIFCFNTRIIDALQTIRTYNRSKLKWSSLVSIFEEEVEN